MNLSKPQEVTHVLLRVASGLMFMQHGGQKLLGWFGGVGSGPVDLASKIGVAGILELGGGLLILLGLFTRPVAFLLSGEMAFAYFTSHQPNGTWPIQNRGELAALYAFVFLFFAAHGAGAFSLDALLRQRRERVPSSRPVAVHGG